jgi:hypothetical protein
MSKHSFSSAETASSADDDDASSVSENDRGSSVDQNPMMSIFASYYGIEEGNSNSEEDANRLIKKKGDIDDALFESEEYVRVWFLYN